MNSKVIILNKNNNSNKYQSNEKFQNKINYQQKTYVDRPIPKKPANRRSKSKFEDIELGEDIQTIYRKSKSKRNQTQKNTTNSNTVNHSRKPSKNNGEYSIPTQLTRHNGIKLKSSIRLNVSNGEKLSCVPIPPAAPKLSSRLLEPSLNYNNISPITNSISITNHSLQPNNGVRKDHKINENITSEILNKYKPTTKRESPKKPITKRESPKKPITKRESPKKHITKRESPKKHITKRESPKKPIIKRESPKKPIIKRESPKKHITKRESPKKHHVKRKSKIKTIKITQSVKDLEVNNMKTNDNKGKKLTGKIDNYKIVNVKTNMKTYEQIKNYMDWSHFIKHKSQLKYYSNLPDMEDKYLTTSISGGIDIFKVYC